MRLGSIADAICAAFNLGQGLRKGPRSTVVFATIAICFPYSSRSLFK